MRLALLLTLLLTACGDHDRPLVFSVGGAPAELAVWETLVVDFERDTGIDVELIRQPANTAQQRQGLIIALHSAQSDPDVFMMDVAWVGLFAAAGWLEPLDGIDTAPFFPSIIETVDTHDGALIALPVYVDGGLLYYRTDLLDAPPATQAALVKTATPIQAAQRDDNRDFYGFVWQGAQYEGLVCSFLEFAGSNGGIVRDDDGRLLVDTPENRRALAFMTDLIWRNELSPPSTYTEMREEEVRAWFQEGSALYERNWPYAWSLHNADDSPVRGRVGVAPFPAPAGAEPVSTLGGWHIGVSRHSDRTADARTFVEYVTSHAAQKRLVTALSWNPGRRDLYEDPDILAGAPHFPRLAEIFRSARPRPVEPYYPQISAVLQRHLSAALSGRVEPDEALAGAQAQIDRLVARYGGEAIGNGQ